MKNSFKGAIFTLATLFLGITFCLIASELLVRTFSPQDLLSITRHQDDSGLFLRTERKNDVKSINERRVLLGFYSTFWDAPKRCVANSFWCLAKS